MREKIMTKEELSRQLDYLQHCTNQLIENTSYRLELQKTLPAIIEAIKEIMLHNSIYIAASEIQNNAKFSDQKVLKRIEAIGKVCDEILGIMRVYHEQETERGYVDTPGGFEHMGDVWKTFLRWEKMLNE
jgi:hypothetical protein